MSIETQLAEARVALHDLATGKAVRVIVDQSGERVEFTAAKMTSLRAYIGDLEAQAAGGATPRGPLRIVL